MSNNTTTKQILLTRRSAAYWRVTFSHPPLNIFGPKTIPQLNEIITEIETGEQLKVVVFDSAVDGFFLTHYDFLAKPEETTSLPPGPTGLQPLAEYNRCFCTPDAIHASCEDYRASSLTMSSMFSCLCTRTER
jgi:enoyl-CoA hydratase/carnithine racemase